MTVPVLCNECILQFSIEETAQSDWKHDEVGHLLLCNIIILIIFFQTFGTTSKQKQKKETNFI